MRLQSIKITQVSLADLKSLRISHLQLDQSNKCLLKPIFYLAYNQILINLFISKYKMVQLWNQEKVSEATRYLSFSTFKNFYSSLKSSILSSIGSLHLCPVNKFGTFM